jgi:hypothetical protein
MISKKQLLANQSNAQLGGVKTDEGKQKIRFNALKHGIWGKLISEYESDIYQDLLADLIDELQPKGIIQNMMVERIAVAYLRLYRLAKAEKEYIVETLHPSEVKIYLDWDTKDGYSSLVGHEVVEIMFSTFSRYETSIENRFYRAIKELRDLKNGFVLQEGNNG